MMTVFIRVFDVPPDDRGRVVRGAVRETGDRRFELDCSAFAKVPGSPFAYWLPARVRDAFSRLEPFEADGRSARQGLATTDDFRFLRAWWEVVASENVRANWPWFARAGGANPFYGQTDLVISWSDNGRVLKALISQRYGNAGKRIYNENWYFHSGFCWPLRGRRFTCLAVGPDAVFGIASKMAFVPADQRLAFLAVLNSAAYDALLRVQAGSTGGIQFESGLVARTPVPSVREEEQELLGSRARDAWMALRKLDARTETSQAFFLPALLLGKGNTLADRAQAWGQLFNTTKAALDALAADIDNCSFQLYGISQEDRQRIEQGFGTSSETEDSSDDDDGDDSDDDGEVAEVDATPMVASLLSWTLGIAFGRFDVRLATGEREAPPDPEPFDPLPVCSPGMPSGDDRLPVAAAPAGYPLTFPADGILVDDPGHPRDVVRAVRSVFETVFDDANARWHEAAELLGTPDLRTWFACDFFEPHIKRYSKSRRKAPIYWQFATASGSYSVWIYIHRATGDTLFRVLNDFVGPKLDHEKAKLDGLTREAGANPYAAQRREIEQQETFVGELQALKTEVARVAPLWKPNFDDGVILNFAPLWRLVPQNRSWQGECKKAWDKLQVGDYDWAHLAMHLWPERVVPKCIDDRSLAIAHGLEEVFWHEDDSGTWRKSLVDDATVQKLIQERTSTTVKAALKDLLSAATPTASKGRRQGSGRRVQGAGRAPRKATQARPKASARATGTLDPDPSTLETVRAAIASMADGASKADVLAATGLTDSDWNKAIAALLDRGDVTRTGQKRGTRYHSQGESNA